MAYRVSNGHVTDDVTWTPKLLEAVRSAILATAWLLVSFVLAWPILSISVDFRLLSCRFWSRYPSFLQGPFGNEKTSPQQCVHTQWTREITYYARYWWHLRQHLSELWGVFWIARLLSQCPTPDNTQRSLVRSKTILPWLRQQIRSIHWLIARTADVGDRFSTTVGTRRTGR